MTPQSVATYSPPPCGEGLGVGVPLPRRLECGSTPPARLRRAALPVKGRAEGHRSPDPFYAGLQRTCARPKP